MAVLNKTSVTNVLLSVLCGMPVACRQDTDSAIEIPPDAANVTIEREAGQHVARFRIEPSQLERWVEKLRAESPELNRSPDNPMWLEGVNEIIREDEIEAERKRFEKRIGSADGFSEHLLKYIIVRSARGGRVTVWYSPVTKNAYLWAVYH